MALIMVTNELLQNIDLFESIIDCFDKFVDLGEQQVGTRTFRVYNDEIPNADILICPEMFFMTGIKPFIIDYGI